MKIQLHEMKVEEKSVLMQLMELYNYEFTEYDDEDVNRYGYYGYDHIDDYWNEEGRHPYLIMVDDKIAGFALICPHCECLNVQDALCFGEFFVMLKYRRKNIGTKVAIELIRKYCGKWEIMYLKNNLRAAYFWKTIVEILKSDMYIENYQLCETEVGDQEGFYFTCLKERVSNSEIIFM